MNPRQEEPISHTFNKLPHSHSITKHTCRLKHTYNDLTHPQAHTDTPLHNQTHALTNWKKRWQAQRRSTINNGCLKAPFVLLLSCLCESVYASVSVGGCWPGGMKKCIRHVEGSALRGQPCSCHAFLPPHSHLCPMNCHHHKEQTPHWLSSKWERTRDLKWQMYTH